MKKSILFIEDDLPTIEVYKRALGKVGFEVEVINFGKKAIGRIKKINEGKAKSPDLVLLDLILPDMSGLQVLGELRKQKKTKDLPVFILTNYTDSELERLGYKLNSEKYLLKTDYAPRQLARLVKERLKQ